MCVVLKSPAARIFAISRRSLLPIAVTEAKLTHNLEIYRRELHDMHKLHPDLCLYHLLSPKTLTHCHYSLRERQHSFSTIQYRILAV